MAKYDYFISFSSKDKHLADSIVDAIESTGHSCWIAPRNIPYGTPYARAIMDGIDECHTFLVIITENSIKSEDVLNEVDNAHAQKKTIIPVRLSDTQLSRELNYYLSRTQWLNLDPINILKIQDLLHLQSKSRAKTQTPPPLDPKAPHIKPPKSISPAQIPRKPICQNQTDYKPTITPHGQKILSSHKPHLQKSINWNLIGQIILCVSIAWFLLSCIISKENDGIFFLTFVTSIIDLCFTIAALISPANIGNLSRTKILLYLGTAAALLFITSIIWIEQEVPSTPTPAYW
ncbi:MAG: toll/interleukin-1 receptor domain-containing protein [Muribaculum sp.]|nr:toll/interleukin-1 receptor domain-containing protein [Muribaculum sp.]